jgi:hypothetical protein
VSILHPHAAIHVRETAGGMEVALPSPRRPVAVVLLAVWLAAWVVGLGFVTQQLVQGDGIGPDAWFLVGWAVVWLVAGAVSAGYLAWLLAGCERITLDGDQLRIRRAVWRVGITRTYATADVHELRTFGRELAPVLAAGLELAGRGASGVRFNYRDDVVLFARALDERAAHALVEQLLAHHAFPDAHGHQPRPGV